MLTIHLHSGHRQTVEAFIASMELSGYTLKIWHPSFTMPSQILKFDRPVAWPPGNWLAEAT